MNDEKAVVHDNDARSHSDGSRTSSLTPRQAAFGIALISMATLMLELLVNKALSFSTWGTLGYMVIGSAIFGFSIAGVTIAVWQPHKKYPLDQLVSWAALIFSVSVTGAYIVMNVVPFNFEEVLTHWIQQSILFLFWYLALLIPFSMTGFIVALLLMEFKHLSNRLYAADLVGAAIGCLMVLPLFPLVGASGQYLLCSAIGAGCTVIFCYKRFPKIRAAAMVLGCLFLSLAPFAESIYPVITHQDKRERAQDFAAGYIDYAMWSFLTKIEVARIPDQNRGMLWFDGGLMQSALDGFDGNYEHAKSDPRMHEATSIPYRMRSRDHALIIAPAGGRELRSALVWGAKHVTGVELDSSIVKFVRNDLDTYLGGIFTNDRVTLLNDDGRSFIGRSTEKYDSIQFISAYSLDAALSGAIIAASSFLVTQEAFDEYLDHLTEQGVLAIAKDFNLRLFFTAWDALERRGLDPAERLMLLSGGSLGRNTVLVKLSPFETSELDVIQTIAANRQIAVNYAPPSVMARINENAQIATEPETQRLIQEFVSTAPENRAAFFDSFPYRVAPVTDDKPFFNNVRYVMNDMSTNPERLSEEMLEYTERTWYLPFVPIGYVGRLVVLCEAALLAFFILVFPLWRWKSEGIRTPWQKIVIPYFLSLGVGFIWIEIILLKLFVLFLGSPVYSIAVILFAILIFAGIGSLISERLVMNIKQTVILLSGLLTGIILMITVLYPEVFRLCLGFSLPARILITIMLVAPIGLVLGLPFPIGLKFLAGKDASSIPWAWATNGYATVVGVSTAVFLAMEVGFSLLLWMALAVYLVGFVFLLLSHNMYVKATNAA